MKIVSTGSTIASPGFLEKKKRLERRRRLLWGVGAFVLLALFIFLSRQERFIINKIEVDGAKTVVSADVESVVRKSISGNYLWLVPHANSLLYSRSNIKESLLNKFSRFNNVGLALEGTNTLRVSVVEREPFALYCESVENLGDASKCYFMDDTGYIFDEAPAFSGPVYFAYSQKEPFLNPLGRQFMPREEFELLYKFVGSLSNLGIKPVALEVSDGELNILLPYNTRIIWQRNADLIAIYSNLEAFLNNESIRSQPDFLEKVSTLDLRVENKVFYTFK